MNTIFEYTPKQLLAIMALVGLVMWFVGLWYALATGLVVGGVIQYRKYLASRPEAAWEISESGTRQLWNDGAKHEIAFGRTRDGMSRPQS